MIVARFALAWTVFAVWTIAVFTALEARWPRVRAPIRWRVIAVGAGLLFVDAAVTRLLTMRAPTATWTDALLAWLVAELLLYWVHRAMHGVPWLWRFHRLHHRSDPLAWSHAWHIHPVDAALFATAVTTASLIVGASLPIAAALVVGRRAWSVLLHANVIWPASMLDHIIATPPFHHRHHREDLRTANFAGTLPIIDRVFGTWDRSIDSPSG